MKKAFRWINLKLVLPIGHLTNMAAGRGCRS